VAPGPGRGALPRPRLSAPPASPQALREAIRAQAFALGFDAVGFAAADLGEETARRLRLFLADGRHGDMAWMATTAQRRARLATLWPEAKSAVVLAMSYAPARDPLALLGAPDRGAISCYAAGDDYHDVVKARLKQLARWLAERHGAAVKVFVDTAPVMEKPLAERAGVGWQGKHTNLVSRTHGSWLFLGEVLTTLDLPPDEAETDHCGSCRRCLEVCPTRAFPAPYQLDARRCISYLTIEHKGPIPREFRKAMGNRIYGCDDCLAVCPWNKFAARTATLAFQPRPELSAPRLADLAQLDDAGFRRVFAKSPIKRLGRDRFVRNVLIALGNSGDIAQAPLVERLLDDASPLVRGAAVWALAQLLPPSRFAALRAQRLPAETVAKVLSEWSAAEG
jgi:epoxyqueuosine reductase